MLCCAVPCQSSIIFIPQQSPAVIVLKHHQQPATALAKVRKHRHIPPPTTLRLPFDKYIFNKPAPRAPRTFLPAPPPPSLLRLVSLLRLSPSCLLCGLCYQLSSFFSFIHPHHLLISLCLLPCRITRHSFASAGPDQRYSTECLLSKPLRLLV